MYDNPLSLWDKSQKLTVKELIKHGVPMKKE